MNQAAIYVIQGISGAGKDTCYQILEKYVPGLLNIKWSSPMKRMMECAYSLSPGSLDGREIRHELVPGHPDGITYGELMVRCWQHFPAIDPMLGKRGLIQSVQDNLSSGTSVAFTDTRNYEEVSEVTKLAAKYPMYLIGVTGLYGSPKTSDNNLGGLTQALYRYCYEYHHIDNSGTLQQLEDQLVRGLNLNHDLSTHH